MVTKSKGIARGPGGAVELEILRAIGHGIVDAKRVARKVNHMLSAKWFPNVLGSMLARGLVYQVRAGDGRQQMVACTAEGLRKLPSAEPPWLEQWQPLRRERVVRRPGSLDHLDLPSVAGGRLIYRETACTR